MNDIFDDFEAMIATLTQDVETCTKRVQRSPAQFWRRMYVRALFASFEGICFFMKQHALYAKCHEIARQFGTGEVHIPTGDLCLLAEESWFLDDQGNVKKRSATIPALPNVLYALRCMAEVAESEHSVNKGEGWQAFQKAIKIRDRLTHPKAKEDMTISDADLDVVEQANGWLQYESMTIISKSKKVKTMAQRGTEEAGVASAPQPQCHVVPEKKGKTGP